jgi:alpha-L-fucosidase
MNKLVVIMVVLFLFVGLCWSEFSWEEVDWEELRSREYPAWFSDAKLGIFIHWGIYSVPSWSTEERYAEWYYRWLTSDYQPVIEHHNQVWGENFEYADFVPQFTAELFDAEEWANLFFNAGARYIILTAKHHDGYCLWDSEYAPDWNSVATGPGLDIVDELTAAVREKDMKAGLYYSLPEWTNELHRWYIDPHDDISGYVNQHMIPQFKELITKYKPELLFADGEWFNSAEDWQARELIGWYYDTVGKEAIVNNRWGSGSDIGFLTPEYSSGMGELSRPWTECRGLGRSFGLNRGEDIAAYLTPEMLIHFFIKAVANGGGMTLNVGPKADGQIPLLQQERLLQLGDWLKVNGEAIYGSKSFIKTGELKENTVERIDEAIDFDWVRNTPCYPIEPDNFSVEWTGYLQAEYSGVYKFETVVDDSMQLWIDDKLILNTKAATGSGICDLEKGKKYPVKIKYYEKETNALLQLCWSCVDKGLDKEIVSSAHYYADDSVTHGLSGRYASNGYRLCYTTNNDALYAIALEWGDEQKLSLENAAEISSISLLGSDIQLNWMVLGNTVIIDTSNFGYHEMPCQYAWVFKLQFK